MHGGVAALKDEQFDIGALAAMLADSCRWAALLTTSGAERKACIWLKMRQFKPYWPRYKGTVKLNRHRRDTRWRSVIAGYVFVPLPEEGELNWQLAERTPGIRAIARPDNTHIILNSSDINDIRRIEAALNASVIAADKGIPFKVGERVRFEIGGRELTGKIIHIDTRRQITVETQIFGRCARTALTADRIEAV